MDKPAVNPKAVRFAVSDQIGRVDTGDENWAILKIFAEFVEGFDFLGELEKEVSFFGSSHLTADDKYYKLAEELAFRLGQSGHTIVTRGGTGIMEAANKGAYRAQARSISLSLRFHYKSEGNVCNRFVTKCLTFDNYFTQKVMMAAIADSYVFFPGGYGTLDNFTEILTLMQTKKMAHLPIVLVGEGFWEQFLEYIEQILWRDYKTITAADMKLYTFVGNDLERALNLLSKAKHRRHF